MPDGPALFISGNLLQRRQSGSEIEVVTPQPGMPNPYRRGKQRPRACTDRVSSAISLA